MFLNRLFTIIKDRQSKLPEGSYITLLTKQGKDRIIQKVGEESVEVVIAAKNGQKDRIIAEVADLLFHVMVMLSFLDISWVDISKELERRNKKK